jgi:hypothetical protein
MKIIKVTKLLNVISNITIFIVGTMFIRLIKKICGSLYDIFSINTSNDVENNRSDNAGIVDILY